LKNLTFYASKQQNNMLMKTLPLLSLPHSLSHWRGTSTHWVGSPPRSHRTHRQKWCDGSVGVSLTQFYFYD